MAATSPGANDAAYRTMGSQGGIHKPLKKNTVLREYYEVDKAQKERVPSAWFEAEISRPEQDGENAKATESHLEHRQELAKKVQTIISEEVNSLGYT